jgi:hypothetical protein
MSGNEALYSQLPLPTKTSIRLIRKESQENALVKLQLSVHDITDPPAYTALSYTWGSPISQATAPLATSAIILCNGRVLRVGKNLYDALCIMATGPEGYIWADAICIDQGNIVERNDQVAMMGSIYAQAQGTFIWLGMDDEVSRVAFKAMTRFVLAVGKMWKEQGVATYNHGFRDHHYWERLGIESWTDREVNAIVHFFNRTWFERAWVVQEVALAKQVLIVCGGSTLWWDVLHPLSQFLYVSGWAHEFHTLKAKALGLPCVSPPGAVPMILQKLRDSYAKGVLCEKLSQEVVTFAALEASPDKIKLFYRALDVAISTFRPFKATIAQDKVYAPLSLITHLFASSSSSPPTILIPKVDYTETKEETFIRFTAAILQHSDNLSFLSHRETRTSSDFRPRHHTRLPSWVPDLSTFTALIESPTPWLEFCYKDMPTTTYVDGRTHRTEAFARTLVCDQLKAKSEAEFAAVFKSYLMYVCAGSYDMASIRQKMSGGGEKEHDGKKQEAVQKDIESHHADTIVSWPILDAFENTDPNPFVPTLAEVQGYIETVMSTQYQAEKGDSWRFHRNAHQLVTKLHYDTSAGRRLITTRKGYIGLAPESVQAGDWIVFLPTSPVPFVIRGIDGKRLFVSDELADGGAYEVEAVRSTEYELHGEVYLHGIMYGEIFEVDLQFTCEEILLV